MQTTPSPQLWTTWADYMATGEGLHMMACITYAVDENDAKQIFLNLFGDFYGSLCEASKGVDRNRVTISLFAQRALDLASNCDGHLHMSASLYVNFS